MTKKTKQKKLAKELAYGEPDCGHCKLSGRPRVMGWGDQAADIMIIDNAPSASRVRDGTPYKGAGGLFLQRTLLPEAGINPDRCYIENVCSCQLAPGKKQPTATMWKACSPRLLAEIAWCAPSMLIVLGESAQKSVLPDYPLIRYHGKKLRLEDRVYVPMYHPTRANTSCFMQQVLLNDFLGLPNQEVIKEVDGEYNIAHNSITVPSGIVSGDVETAGLYGQLLGGALTAEPGKATYCKGQAIVKSLNDAVFPHLLFHNVKYDLRVLLDNGYNGKYGEIDDSELLAYCMGYPKLSLKVLETQELNLTHPDYDAMVPAGTLADIPVEETARYCCQDADVTLRFWRYLVKEADEREYKLYEKVEKPLAPVLVDMERLGVKVDLDYAREWQADLLKQRSPVDKQLQDDFQLTEKVLNSPKQLGEWLVSEGVHLPTTTSGQYATGKELLAALKDKHPAILLILQRRQINKLLSTYVNACLELTDEEAILHPQWNQTRVVTGRLSASEPNLQNLPYTFAARRPFIARPGNVLLSVDYSQVDMRVLAAIVQDPALIAAFEAGEDIHNWMSIQLFGDCEPMHRHIIKSASYLSIYGGTPKSLHTYLNAPMGEFDLAKMGKPPSLEECKRIIDTYYDKFKKVSEWQEVTKQHLRNTGYVEDYYGRRRYIPNINSTNPRIYRAAERMAINFPIAGTAGDIFKLSITAAAKHWTPTMNIHDELVFDVPEGKVEGLIPKVKAAMEGLDFPVPLVVKYKTGQNLGELL